MISTFWVFFLLLIFLFLFFNFKFENWRIIKLAQQFVFTASFLPEDTTIKPTNLLIQEVITKTKLK